MSDTPETDRQASGIDQSNFEDSWKDDFEPYAWVQADFARKLERDRDRLREALERIVLEDGRPMSMRIASPASIARDALNRHSENEQP